MEASPHVRSDLDPPVPERPLSRRVSTVAPATEHAHSLFPNGVTHDLRYLEPFPIYIDRAAGARKWDVDGHELIDFWSGHGSLLLGHSHPDVVAAVQQQAGRATHPGGCHELEMEWGDWCKKLVPSAEKLRFVNSGTEATLMALRLARIFTGQAARAQVRRPFPRLARLPHPGRRPPLRRHPRARHPARGAGRRPSSCRRTTRPPSTRPWPAIRQIGCVILEPTGGHFGAVPVRGEFLQGPARDHDASIGRLLIFDEVISGFRVHPGGAQGLYGVKPDLTTLAKILAGGLPGGCLAGRADILAALEFRPGKPKMKHPGTFNANPLSAAAGVATLALRRRRASRAARPTRWADSSARS